MGHLPLSFGVVLWLPSPLYQSTPNGSTTAKRRGYYPSLQIRNEAWRDEGTCPRSRRLSVAELETELWFPESHPETTLPVVACGLHRLD